MVNFKTEEEIAIIKEGGARLKKVMEKLRPMIEIGMTTKEIDQNAERLIIVQGGEPSFKKVPSFHWATCLPINEQIVHTPPSGRKLIEGDILTIDIGMYYRGFHTDYADTIAIGAITTDTKHFLTVGKNTLIKAINAVKVGQRLGVVSGVIEDEIYGHGYKVIKELTGHGIGRALHEDPYVFGYREKKTEKTLMMREGLVIAIEIIYSKSCEQIAYEKNNDWSVTTADKSLSACFEHTVAISGQGTIVVT